MCTVLQWIRICWWWPLGASSNLCKKMANLSTLTHSHTQNEYFNKNTPRRWTNPKKAKDKIENKFKERRKKTTILFRKEVNKLTFSCIAITCNWILVGKTKTETQISCIEIEQRKRSIWLWIEEMNKIYLRSERRKKKFSALVFFSFWQKWRKMVGFCG